MTAAPALESRPAPPSDNAAPEPGHPAPARTVTADALGQLIVQRVWLYARRRKAWLDTLARQAGSSECGEFFTDPDDPAREERWLLSGEGSVWLDPIHALDTQLSGALGRPLHLLAGTFGLSQPELDLLQTCLAHQLDPTLGPVFAFMHGQNQSGFVSGPLVKRLYRHSSNAFWHPLADVRRWKLVHAHETHPGEPTAFSADLTLIPWIEGRLIPDPGLARLIRPAPAEPAVESWPVDEAAQVIERSALHAAPVRLVITGRTGSGRCSFASASARKLGLDCIVIDTTTVADDEWPEVFLRVQRFASLGRLGVIWTGSQVQRRWPSGLDSTLAHIIVCEDEQDVAMPGWTDRHVTLPSPSLNEKRTLWRRACAQFDQWAEEDRTALTQCYELSAGQIAAVGKMQPADGRQAITCARDITRQSLGNLGQFLPCPFTWDDIVLPSELRAALQDLAYEARTRGEFWDQPKARRLFPRGTGLTALLSGTPGTGKTMAAQVIAAELQLDLFRVDLARVVSKYIGETAKHLSEIFSRASQMSAILLFDEADALFAKRTQVKDAHDRYANSDTSYLLQLLEEFRGLALLTTNKRGGIDPAFYRRLRYVYEFPKPGPSDRFRIWQQLTRDLYGEETCSGLAPTQQKLAEQMPISPAQIKATLLAATFIAQRQGRPLLPVDLIKALEREMAKEGRGVDDGMRQSMDPN